MDPNQNRYSIDYLNEISPQQKKPGVNNKLFMVVVLGGGLLALVLGASLLFGGGNSGPTYNTQLLAARLQVLHEIADDSHDKIKSGDLRSTNSALTIFLTNSSRDIAEPLQAQGLSLDDLNEQAVASEEAAGSELSATLEDARLNAIFDRVYGQEMNYQLDKIAILMEQIQSNTSSETTRDFLASTGEFMQPINQQLHDFNTVE